MNITFTAKNTVGKAKAKHALVLLASSKGELGTQGKALDKNTKGAISRALKSADFKGSLSLHGVDGLTADRVVVVSVGDAKSLDTKAVQDLGGKAIDAANAVKAKTAEIVVEGVKSKLSAGEIAAQVAFGAELKDYMFDKYFTKKSSYEKRTLTKIAVVSKADKEAKKAFQPLQAIADGVMATRNVVSEPGNIIYPETLAAACKELTKLGVKVEVLNEAKMEKLGMGALLGVGQGSVRESQLIVMQWNGGKKSDKPVAFVGKGVTFDTGGISIKPAGGMEEMKFDMGGSGTVLGLMKALAGRNAKANVVGVIGAVENMPDGNAQRPGDVVTSMSGQTIEVLNTDAEGRLVLADALWYTQDRFKPKFIIDLATLTGAILVALGSSRAGIFSNNDKLAKQLEEAADKTGEDVWRLPIGDVYDKQINSQVADMQNIGTDREAGSITAAQFLQRFVNDVPWVHIDIAGTAWTKKDHPTVPKGATGYGVRLLNQLVEDHYEN